MLAYYVTHDDYGGEIVFAESPQHLDDPESPRAPKYDKFAELGYVPAKVLYEEGWDMFCSECEKSFSEIEWEEEELDPVLVKDEAFCTQSCYDSYFKKLLKRKERKEKAFADFKRRYPDTKVLGTLASEEYVEIDFKFPGGEYECHWNDKSPDIVQINQSDAEAWNIYSQSIK